jgi:hypothetical protein
MNTRQPTLLKSTNSIPHYLYFFFGTVDHKWNRNEWMFVKVGIASNVRRRLVSYQTHCPVPFHMGLQVALPNVKRARILESAILKDEEICEYNSQGEWFVVFAGPHQHMIFITILLGRFYIERYRDKSLWDCRLEWVIVPNQERLAEIPEADAHFFCGIENGEKITYAEGEDQIIGTELNRRVKAENQAKALCDLVYPGFEDRQGWDSDNDSSVDDDSSD